MGNAALLLDIVPEYVGRSGRQAQLVDLGINTGREGKGGRGRKYVPRTKIRRTHCHRVGNLVVVGRRWVKVGKAENRH